MADFDGVIFDMDGTLVVSPLDFVAIRATLGIAPGNGILEEIQAMPPHRKTPADRRLLEMEMAAAAKATVMPGAIEVVEAVRLAGLRTALLTRNARQVVAAILDRFADLRFDLTWSREDGPIKPEPDGILRACDTLDIDPARTACVGDYAYDIDAANAAGTTSILLATGEAPEFAKDADVVIKTLAQLPAVLGI